MFAARADTQLKKQFAYREAGAVRKEQFQ